MGRTSSTPMPAWLVCVVVVWCLACADLASALDCPRSLGCGIVGCACGDTVVSDFEMTSNITCPSGHTGFGLKVASGVSLRSPASQVFQIVGPGTMGASSYGILIDGGSNISVLLVRVAGFREGVHIQNANNTLLWGVETIGNGAASDSAGISIAGGSGNGVYGCTVDNNADVGIRLNGTSGVTVMTSLVRYNGAENLRLVNVSGAQIINTTTAGGTASLYAEHSSGNVFSSNSFADGSVVFAGNCTNNDFGKDDVGNTISGGLLELRQHEDSVPSGNRALKPQVTNSAPGAHCIDFVADAGSSQPELPSANYISEAMLTCGAEEIHVTAGGTQGPNPLCACVGTGGGACDVALDPFAPDIIAPFSFPCL